MPGSDPGHQSPSPAPSCWPGTLGGPLALLGPCLSSAELSEPISEDPSETWGTAGVGGREAGGALWAPAPGPRLRLCSDAFCLQPLVPATPPTQAWHSDTCVVAMRGCARGPPPGTGGPALQRWEGLLRKGPHSGAFSSGSSWGFCLPCSVQRHLPHSGPLSPRPDTLSGRRRSCSARPAPPLGLVTQELLTVQPEGDFLLTPEPGSVPLAPRALASTPGAPAARSSPRSLGSLWPQHRPLQRSGNQAQRPHLIYF